jgi:hypothetical protein
VKIDRCDFQIPPAGPGWYGVMGADAAGNLLHQAAYWDGNDWTKYPVRAYARSMGTFPTREAALAWTLAQLD